MGNDERAHKKISPKSGRGLDHVTLQLLAHDEHIFKSILASDFKFGKQHLTYHGYLTLGFCTTVRQ